MTNHIQTNAYTIEQIFSKYDLRSWIDSYFQLLAEYNKKVNLVSRETGPADWRKITADSLIPFEYISCNSGKILDIGSGAGFPLIIILGARPAFSGVAVERIGKKADFLSLAAKELKIQFSVIKGNFVEIDRELKQGLFDLITMKLVRLEKREFGRIIECLKPGGYFIYYSSAKNLSFDPPENIGVREINYHLEGYPAPRTMAIFQK